MYLCNMNTFGKNLRLTTFGESHGPAIGGVLDGFPAGIKIDFELVRAEMEARRPGGKGVSQRKESDSPEFLSGISPEGISLGSPIAFIIRNSDTRSGDYDQLANSFRPNHADYTYWKKYGIRDHRGGGRASARETAPRVTAGALALQLLDSFGIEIKAFLTAVGPTGDRDLLDRLARKPELATSYSPSSDLHAAMMEEVEKARMDKDSVGGRVTGIITGLPAGIGQPIYRKLNSRLAEAMMGINAAKGFEIGLGMALAEKRGSEVLDNFLLKENGEIATATNYSGGIQGGISNGMPVFFNVAFKPTPTIGLPVEVMTTDGKTETVTIPGRHDPCVAVRAVAVVKAMAALVTADFIMGASLQDKL